MSDLILLALVLVAAGGIGTDAGELSHCAVGRTRCA